MWRAYFLVGCRDVDGHLGCFTRVPHFYEVGEALKLAGPGPLHLRFPARGAQGGTGDMDGHGNALIRLGLVEQPRVQD